MDEVEPTKSRMAGTTNTSSRRFILANDEEEGEEASAFTGNEDIFVAAGSDAFLIGLISGSKLSFSERKGEDMEAASSSSVFSSS